MAYPVEGQVDRVMDIGAFKLQEILPVCKRFASIHVIYGAYLHTIHLPGFYLEERMLTFSLSICVPELPIVWLLLVKSVQEEKKQVLYFSCLDPLWDVKKGTE